MTAAANRMRASRQRQRDGLRCVRFEVRDTEIEGLMARGLLDPVARNNRQAIAAALGELMDQLPDEWWNASPANPGLVSLNLTGGFIDLLETLGWLPAAAPRDSTTIKAALVGFIKRACSLSIQTPAPFRADRNATGG